MSEPKFTKAPWLLANDGSPFVYALNEEGNQNRFWLHIARGFVKNESWEDARVASDEVLANAHLISAAPDLYEALSEVDEIFNESWYTDKQLVMKIKAALKKARGE